MAEPTKSSPTKRSPGPHQPPLSRTNLPTGPSYYTRSGLITEKESESDDQSPSSDVSELAAKEVTVEKVTLPAARMKRKRSKEPLDSKSSDGEGAIHNKCVSVL